MTPTTRVLVAADRHGEIEALASALEAEGIVATAAVGGLFVLTCLERQSPDMIVTTSDLGDMDGHELCSLIKHDRAIRQIAVVLWARDDAEHAAAQRRMNEATTERFAAFDRIIVGDRHAAALELRRWLQPSSGSFPAIELDDSDDAEAQGTLSGSLGVLSFAELVQAFSQTSKTGCLELDLGGGGAVVLFDRGRIRHATYGSSQGADAFADVFYASERRSATKFRFAPWSVERMAQQVDTIAQDPQQLLLAVAVELDELDALSKGDGSAKRNALLENLRRD